MSGQCWLDYSLGGTTCFPNLPYLCCHIKEKRNESWWPSSQSSPLVCSTEKSLSLLTAKPLSQLWWCVEVLTYRTLARVQYFIPFVRNLEGIKVVTWSVGAKPGHVRFLTEDCYKYAGLSYEGLDTSTERSVLRKKGGENWGKDALFLCNQYFSWRKKWIQSQKHTSLPSHSWTPSNLIKLMQDWTDLIIILLSTYFRYHRLPGLRFLFTPPKKPLLRLLRCENCLGVGFDLCQRKLPNPIPNVNIKFLSCWSSSRFFIHGSGFSRLD